jgi:hypothetical protein
MAWLVLSLVRLWQGEGVRSGLYSCCRFAGKPTLAVLVLRRLQATCSAQTFTRSLRKFLTAAKFVKKMCKSCNLFWFCCILLAFFRDFYRFLLTLCNSIYYNIRIDTATYLRDGKQRKTHPHLPLL